MSYAEADESTVLIYFCVIAPMIITLCAIFMRRRTLHPLVGRHPKLTLAAVAIASVLLLTTLVNLSSTLLPGMMPCGVFWWIVGTCWNWTAMVLLHRCQLLLWQLRITQDSLTAQQLQKWQPGWYTVRRHWVHKRVWTRIWTIFICVQSLMIAVTAHISEFPLSCYNLYSANYTFVRIYLAVTLAIGLTLGVCLLIMAIALHGEDDDALGLMHEFRILSAVVITTSIIICILMIVHRYSYHPLQWLANTISWLLTCSTTIICLTALCWPLYLSWCWERQVREVGAINQLAPLLEIPGAYQAFLSFTAKEFTSENLLFYARVRDLQMKGDPPVIATNGRGSPKMPSSPTTRTTTFANNTTTTAATIGRTGVRPAFGTSTITPGQITAVVPMTSAFAQNSGTDSPVGGHGGSSSSPHFSFAPTPPPAILPFVTPQRSQPQQQQQEPRPLLSPSQIMAEADIIYENFVRPGAPLEINLDAVTRGDIEVKLATYRAIVMQLEVSSPTQYGKSFPMSPTTMFSPVVQVRRTSTGGTISHVTGAGSTSVPAAPSTLMAVTSTSHTNNISSNNTNNTTSVINISPPALTTVKSASLLRTDDISNTTSNSTLTYGGRSLHGGRHSRTETPPPPYMTATATSIPIVTATPIAANNGNTTTNTNNNNNNNTNTNTSTTTNNTDATSSSPTIIRVTSAPAPSSPAHLAVPHRALTIHTGDKDDITTMVLGLGPMTMPPSLQPGSGREGVPPPNFTLNTPVHGPNGNNGNGHIAPDMESRLMVSSLTGAHTNHRFSTPTTPMNHYHHHHRPSGASRGSHSAMLGLAPGSGMPHTGIPMGLPPMMGTTPIHHMMATSPYHGGGMTHGFITSPHATRLHMIPPSPQHTNTLNTNAILGSTTGTSTVPGAITQQAAEDDICRKIAHVYDRAQNLILRLMQSNSFARFHASQVFKSFLQDYKGWFQGAVVRSPAAIRVNATRASPSPGGGAHHSVDDVDPDGIYAQSTTYPYQQHQPHAINSPIGGAPLISTGVPVLPLAAYSPAVLGVIPGVGGHHTPPAWGSELPIGVSMQQSQTR